MKLDSVFAGMAMAFLLCEMVAVFAWHICPGSGLDVLVTIFATSAFVCCVFAAAVIAVEAMGDKP